MAIDHRRYTTRKATAADIPALNETHESESHERRLVPGGHSHHPENCVLVVEEAGRIIGSVYILFARSLAWPDANDTSQLPQFISLVVKKECRNQGAGTCLIQAIEEEVKSRGLDRVYLGVDHEDAGARRLYNRLGFKPVSSEMRRTSWMYTDDDGIEQEEVVWLIDMVKKLS